MKTQYFASFAEWFNYLSYQLFKVGLLVNFVGHSLLAIPVFGYQALDITQHNYIVFLFISHILTTILAHYHGYSKIPSVFGAFTTVFGFIPYLGWIMHFITAVLTGPLSIRLIFSCKYSKRHRPLSERIAKRV